MDLQTFISLQEDLGTVCRITVPVDPKLEIAALCRREFSASEKRILLFEQVVGASLPLVANLFATEARLAMMLRSASLQEFSQRVQHFFATAPDPSAPGIRTAGQAPAEAANPFCQRVVQGPDLALLPALTSWPAEENPYLNLGLLLTRHPETGATNLGLYRAQRIAKDRLAINFAPGSGAAEHLAVAKAQGKPLPVCLFFGGDPAWIWAAAAPLPEGWDELSFCRQLMEADHSLVPCLSQPLLVPASAEVVIEGAIHPGEICVEGPFGNHTGSYVTRQDCPLLRVTAISHRQQPIMPMTVVGPPPSENVNLGLANEILIRELLRNDFPQVLDIRMPLTTIFHGVCLLKIVAGRVMATRELIYALWDSSPLKRSKLLVLLDADVDLTSFEHCWWAAINRMRHGKLYQRGNQIAIDATGVDPKRLVVENQQTAALLRARSGEYNL